MIDMPHAVSTGAVKRPANYSNCPLKKRPIKYDLADESDSDLSLHDSSPAPMEVSEPENLSTKPEDLRLTLKSGASSAELGSPPPIALVAGRGELSSPTSYLQNSYCPQFYGPTPPYSPGSYLPLPEPPVLKYLPSSGGPLEPISLNPPAVWPRVSPFSAFNFANSGARPQPNSNPIQHYSRHQNHQNEQQHLYSANANYSKGSNSGVRNQSQAYLPQSHYAPFINSRGESGSPPHVSPPLKTEASYPLMKPEVHRAMISPVENNTRLMDDSIKGSIIKREMTHTNYHTLSRESVISHSHGHGHNHGHSCSSGVSSPTSSTSSSCGSSSSSHGIPPMTTPTNGGSVRYQCSDCSKSYSTYSGLTKHVQFHCSSQNKKSFICKFCEKVYVSLGALKMHIRTHTLPCKCTLCGKAFSRPWLLQGHIRTHTGEKPFACQHCNRAFADRSNLRAHLQTHSEVKRYSCKICSKTFSRMSLLAKHEDSGCASTLSN